MDNRFHEETHGTGIVKAQKRCFRISVALTPLERAIFKLYCEDQGKTMASALRSALKSEIRRHKSRVHRYSNLFNIEEKCIINSLSKEIGGKVENK